MNFDVRRSVDSTESAERTHLGKMSDIDHAVLEYFNYFSKVADLKKKTTRRNNSPRKKKTKFKSKLN